MPEPPLPTNAAAEHAPTAIAPTEHPSPSSPGMKDAGHAAVDQGPYEGGLQDDRVAPRISIPGIVCAPPDILPPSPPLTVADAREDHESAAGGSSSQLATNSQSAAAGAPPPMREEDITSWRVSMSGGTAEKQRELRAQDEAEETPGEYDPYDLGYSPETPIGPSHARAPGMPAGAASLQQTLEHPLRSTGNPQTPPLWEVISPPPSAPGVPHGGQRPLTTRPLIPRSGYYFGPPPIDSAYGTDPVGHIGVHHPREILRIERDYTSGEIPQFAATYLLELEGRINPTQFLDTINTINEHLIEAYSLQHSFIDTALAFFTLQLSRLVLRSHYEKEMARLRSAIDDLNTKVYNPVGLNILWPRKMAFMFLEIEYY
ncbi:hypothetical protein PHLGIDRAFT_93490 [Phlebiopsis gigantea 11061_1 CR5-6]|uniref:Ras modification protein ERF4 n=1 Tax=Phlebiopsis gigantea (strain 11061_1 CR5-6) TaxID=745531 RepID=A0A0C3RU56_PHLG1|nr:hypothetical protein PHLGIDRAFT_93490 [Phlebiopsis gigantea 11061_1 CR5-6]